MIQASLGEAAVLAAMLAAFASFGTCLAIVATRSWHEALTADGLVGVQKFHTTPTPRVGGIAIFAGIAVTLAIAPGSTASLLLLMLVSAVPAFASGLLEDVTKRAGVLSRLVATLTSGVLAWGLMGAVIQRTGWPALDVLFAFVPFAVLFTAFCVGGMANAVNIIDGFNGLAGGAVVLMLAALGFIAAQAGDADLARVCLLAAAAVAGFLLVNWPLGKLFLGDGGAYLLGFLVGLTAVLLVGRNPQVSPWAPLVVCAYPVFEVLFSVHRKCVREGGGPGQPDGVHLHMLVHRRVVRRLMPGAKPWLRNAMTSPFAWVFTAATALWGAAFHTEPLALVAGFALAAFAYSRVYTRIAKFSWWPVKPAARGPVPQQAQAMSAVPARRELAALASTSVRRATHLYASAARGRVPPAPARPRVTPAFATPGAIFGAIPGATAGAAPSPTERALYVLLGLSSCVALVEPSPFELLALLLMALHATKNLHAPWWRVAGPLGASMLLVLGLFVFMQFLPIALQARSPANSAFYAGVTSMLILIALHLGRLHGSADGRFAAFLAGYAVAALASSLLAVATLHPAVALWPDLLQLAGRPRAFFKDPNVLGPFLVPAVLVFLEAAGRARRGRVALLALCATVCAAGVLATGSRAAWINLAIVLALYALLSSRRQLAMAALMAAFAAVPVAVIVAQGLGEAALDTLALYDSRVQLQDYDTDRFAMASQAIELGWRYPAGVGPGEVAGYLGMSPGMDPHNTYVRIWAENGPVALMLFSVFLLLLMAHAVHECIGRRMQPAFICAFAVLAGALVNAGVVDTLHWRHFWIILAVCVFSFNPRRRAVREARAARAGPAWRPAPMRP